MLLDEIKNFLGSLILEIKINYLGTNKADSLPKISATVDSNSLKKKLFVNIYSVFQMVLLLL